MKPRPHGLKPSRSRLLTLAFPKTTHVCVPSRLWLLKKPRHWKHLLHVLMLPRKNSLTLAWPLKKLGNGQLNKSNRRWPTMPSQNLKPQEMEVLLQLSPEQVEQAWKWLDDPTPTPPPPELNFLSLLEWHLLELLLVNLMEEKEHHPLQ
jgi:hypothetical protein